MSISPPLYNMYSSIAQSVEQRTVNPWVSGSSPLRGAKVLREWWNGRHAGLRSQCQKRESSSLSFRTKMLALICELCYNECISRRISTVVVATAL